MRTTLATLVCLLGLLIAMYGLSYAGAFTADDEHLFISGAQSLAQWGRFEVPQVYGNTRFYAEWRDVEPAQPFLGALLVGWGDALGLGRVQTPFILNSFVTAFTACIIFLTARLRAAHSTALLVALIYGLATIAWPYAKTYFRDPLAALLLAVAYLGYELARDPARRKAGLVLVVIGVAGGLLAKATIAVALLVFPLAALIESGNSLWSWPRLKIPLAAAVVLVAVGLIVSVSVPVTGPMNRLSWPYLSFLFSYALQAPYIAFGEAMVGPFVSPGKGIFLFSPPLLLALFVFVADYRHWRTWLVPWLVTLALVFIQAVYYDSGWWGFANWGLRFTLPAVPLLAVACAPMVELLWRRARWIVITLFATGVLVQIGGVAVNARAYLASLFETAPGGVEQLAVWHLSTSAVIMHWQMLLQGQGVDLAWARLLPINAAPVAWTIFGWLILFTVSIYGLRRAWDGQAVPAAGPLLVMMLVGVLPGLMLRAYVHDPFYSGDRRAFADALTYLNQSVTDGDVVVVQSYGEPIWHYFLNYARLPVRWYSLPIHFPSTDRLDHFLATGEADLALDPAANSLFNRLSLAQCRLWLVNAPDVAPDSFELPRRWLADHFPATAEREFADSFGRVRVTTFIISPACSFAAP